MNKMDIEGGNPIDVEAYLKDNAPTFLKQELNDYRKDLESEGLTPEEIRMELGQFLLKRLKESEKAQYIPVKPQPVKEEGKKGVLDMELPGDSSWPELG